MARTAERTAWYVTTPTSSTPCWTILYFFFPRPCDPAESMSAVQMKHCRDCSPTVSSHRPRNGLIEVTAVGKVCLRHTKLSAAQSNELRWYQRIHLQGRYCKLPRLAMELYPADQNAPWLRSDDEMPREKNLQAGLPVPQALYLVAGPAGSPIREVQ